MADNRKKKKLDGKRIAVSQPHELRYWCKVLGVTAERLRAAVKAVGTSAVRVRVYMVDDKWACGDG